MALIFSGHTACALCGEILKEGDMIEGLPPLSEKTHPLYKYFDCGFHKSCFDSWDKKTEALALLNEEQRKFKHSDYYREMSAAYARMGKELPGNRGEEKNNDL
ncbi:MAG TPA: hypothetical protein PL029_05070 [Bacteroidia bacterium]|nr:hypothetical protein [Bacteroidia bacterium]